MIVPRFDVTTALRIVSLVYVVMPITVWAVLRGRHDPAPLRAWCGGAMLYGLGYLLVGLRGQLPALVSIHIAAALIYASYVLRVAALRMENGRRLSPRLGAAIFGLALAVFVVADLHAEWLRFFATGMLQMLGAAWLAASAASLWRGRRLRSAKLIAGAYAGFAFAVGAATWIAAPAVWSHVLDRPGVPAVLAITAGVLAGLFSSLGYIGLALERAHRQGLAQAAELARAEAQRLGAEQTADQLGTWLAEREELLRLLAHEVRQPLHSATAALQSAQLALGPAPPGDGQAATTADQRVQRAERVLGGVIGTLDNMLAVTSLLAGPDRAEPRDCDVDTLVALALGDLAAEQRARVQVDRRAATRTAPMDAGLMRLALRNALSHALGAASAGNAVALRISDSDEPLALVFEVALEGADPDPALSAQIAGPGGPGLGTPAQGLGLHVTRRVMEMHGGQVSLLPNPGGGTVLRLQLLLQLGLPGAAAPAAALPRVLAAQA